MKEIHLISVFHRDIHPSNIMVNVHSLQMILIDLDFSCISNEDCSIPDRYVQNLTYTKNSFGLHTKAEHLDWYSVGLICLEILSYHLNKSLYDSHYFNDMKDDLSDLCTYIYPKCSIHQKQFDLFCKMILIPCFQETKIDYTSFVDFYKMYYEKTGFFILEGEGKGVYFYNVLYKNMFDHIMTHTFPTKIILLKNGNNYSHIITMDNETDVNHSTSLIIRGTHYWSGRNCTSAFDYEKIAEGQSKLLLESEKCHPSNDYVNQTYTCPYISISCEPLRCRLNPYQLPLFEINTLVNDQRMLKNVDPYDSRLFKNVMWWGNQLFYFDLQTKNYWIPFISMYYSDSVPFNQEDNPNLVIDKEKNRNKIISFIFIAKNCTSQIRNDLLRILEQMDHPNPIYKKVRSYGSCLNNMNLQKHPRDNNAETCIKNNMAGYWNNLPCIYSDSKFTFAIENTLSPGYITEKILMAFQANSVPIYYGPPEIKTIFNPNSFYYMNDKMVDPMNPTDEELYEIAIELWGLAEDESENGWKRFLAVPKFMNDIVPDLFLYKTSKWMETLIDDFKLKYNKQLESFKGQKQKRKSQKQKRKSQKQKRKSQKQKRNSQKRITNH